MTCQELFACVERLELCTGCEILAMTAHYAQCKQCRDELRTIAMEREREQDYDQQQTEALIVDTIKRANRATTDPERVH